MDSLPNDLVPLPTMPYDERPVELALEIDECRTALWLAGGNVTDAAKILKTTSLRLRSFIKKSPFLTAEQMEAKDQIVDKAESIVVAALNDAEDKARQDTMARFVLGSQGRSRGWGSGAGPGVNIKNGHGGTIVVQWADGTNINDNGPPTIEGEVADG